MYLICETGSAKGSSITCRKKEADALSSARAIAGQRQQWIAVWDDAASTWVATFGPSGRKVEGYWSEWCESQMQAQVNAEVVHA